MFGSSILAFFKNEALLKLGFLAVMLILLYDSLWANSNNSSPPPSPTPIITPSALPTPNSTEVGLPDYVCTEWDKRDSQVPPLKIFICYETAQ